MDKMDELMLMKDMSDGQRILFQAEMNKVRKSRSTAFLLTLFLGGIGAHHFYMGNTVVGVIYLLFFWTGIPLVMAFIELFLIQNTVDQYNEKMALEIAMRIEALNL